MVPSCCHLSLYIGSNGTGKSILHGQRILKHSAMEITKKNHPSHPHTLTLKPSGTPYICSGCQELGFGPSYRCENKNCTFILHDECATMSTFAYHPYFKDSEFKSYEKAPGSRGRYCDACGKDVQGFVYHCAHKGYDLHPCCMKLPYSISGRVGELILKLCKKVPSECLRCKSKDVVKGVRGWSYASKDGKYCYHVSCVKELVLENWKRGHFSQETANEIQLSDHLESQIALASMEVSRRSSRATLSKYGRIVKLVFKLIFSAIFGDPISAIVALVEAMVSN